MSASQKNQKIIEECVGRLISRAVNSRGLESAQLLPRISQTLEKYLLKDEPSATKNQIAEFVESLNVDDLCLVVACEGNDESAWNELVAKFDSTVKSAARKFASSVEDTDDLASSIWAELYGLKKSTDGKTRGKLGYYSGRGSLAGWLRAVVSQLAIDQFRKESRFVRIEEAREFENLAQDSSTKKENELVLHSSDNPEESLTQKQTAGDVAQALHSAIAELESEDRLILKMYYFDEVKLKDIGATFGFHEATASRKLVRIQTEIRKSVEKILTQKNGWKREEVSRHLADAAAAQDLSFEKLIAVFAFAAFVQEYLAKLVL